MKRIIPVLFLVLILSTSVVWADPRPPSAIELAATTATEMTLSRYYPPGAGVIAQGTVWGATLTEYGELFATITEAPGERGNNALTLLSVEGSPLGDGWVTERERYTLSSYEKALAAHGY